MVPALYRECTVVFLVAPCQGGRGCVPIEDRLIEDEEAE